MMNLFTKAFRRYLLGRGFRFQFTASEDPGISLERLNASGIEALHIYVHIPFCKHTCPYCPYNKVPWDAELAGQYFPALKAEIITYADVIGRFQVPSIYFGGGSPAISPLDLVDGLTLLREVFLITGDVCLEITPAECSKETLRVLKDAGVSVISVGIQSFKNELLNLIGRSYDGVTALKALKNTVELFENVNVDLMFALPHQTLKELESDLKTAIDNGATQITVYPLFTFPYSTIGRYKRLKRVKMPNFMVRRRQYYFVYDYLVSEGYEPVSVWSFMKKASNSKSVKYSSVTREYYLGFGAGAGSYFPWGFYLNTFPVQAYIERLSMGKLPTSLEFAFNKRMDDLFWLYWRFYDTVISKQEFEKRFGKDPKVKRIVEFFRKVGFLTDEGGYFRLTKRGAFWIHLAQNYFALNYVNTIWSRALIEPFPELIEF